VTTASSTTSSTTTTTTTAHPLRQLQRWCSSGRISGNAVDPKIRTRSDIRTPTVVQHTIQTVPAAVTVVVAVAVN